MSHPERIVPDETEPGIVALHVKRYEFALPWCAGREVLDAGCGVGYGSALLAERAARVLGVDVAEDAIAYARARYRRENLEFRRGDLLALDLPDASCDVVCSFETIEHLPDVDAGLRELVRILRPGGTCILSTPQAVSTTRSSANPFHEVEFSRNDLERLLRGHFAEVTIYGQRRLETARHRLLKRLDVLGLRRRVPFLRRASALTGTSPTEQVTAEEIVISRERLDRATELVAVCRVP